MSSLLIHSESDDDSSSLSSSDEEQELQQEVANQQQLLIEEEEGDIYNEPKIPLSTSIFLEKLPKPQQEQLNQQIEEQQQRNHQLSSQRDSSEDKKKNDNDSKNTTIAKPTEEEEVTKITIRFQPIGSTPHIQPKVFKISSTSTIATINKFLIKKLKTKSLIYIYIQNSFSPNPDEKIIDLFNLFKTNNELIISYCNTIAFG
ncbi:ATG12 [[Candida] subhashii]|uniref:ATG12 n=1 Tax=[Candida] subhashii TaxID=561895 RepID=A0A8J5QKG8_9ASCO|nr:ATG12 [[Candida] subhashii]KAG7662546.1 ATG12 [[Candida] subhashii]